MQYDSDYEVRLATLAALGGDTSVRYDSVYEIDLEILRLTEGGGGGGTGSSIDDNAIASDKTWSSQKINSELSEKQDALTAGSNISIDNGVISATQPDVSGFALSADVATELATKQDTLTAGDNITISEGVISAQQPDLSGYALSADVATELASKQGTLTAGDNITIDNGVISAQQPSLENYATIQDLNNGLSFKQNTLTAGTGINIINDEISAESEIDDLHASTATTYSSSKITELIQGLGFDTEVVLELPATGNPQTIYLIAKDDAETNNIYDEYIYTQNDWEKIGSTSTDLTQYYTKSEADTLLAGKQQTLTAGTGIDITDGVISSTGGGTELSAGTNISIVDNGINALGYTYGSTLNSVKMGESLNASGRNSVVVGQYNRSRTTSSGDTIFAIGVGTGTETANRVNAVEVLSNGKVYVNGVGDYAGQGMASTKPLDTVINEKVSSTTVATIWSGTQAEYDAITTKNANTLYIIK